MAAADPFDLEARYRRLRDVLDGPVTGRWAILHVDEFLSQFDVEAPAAESYLLSLAEPLAERAAQLDPIGLHPDQLLGLAGQLQLARAAHPLLQECETALQAERALRRRAGLLYGYAGAAGHAVGCVRPTDSAEKSLGEVEGSPRARLQAMRERAEHTELGEELGWMLDHWERPVQGGTHVPVVERLPSWAHSPHDDGRSVGGLRRLALHIHGPAAAKDRIRTEGTARETDDSSFIDVPVAAARGLLADRYSRLEQQFVTGHVAFDRTDLTHEGRSAGMAIAALFYAAVLAHSRRRLRLQIRPEVLLTGSVSPDGTVRPVEEEGLSVKVRTAFFSPKTRLVVPAPQRTTARSARDELLDEFPHGELDITGVEHLKGVFYDRRLTSQTRIGWTRHTINRLWERRGQLLSGGLVLGLLLVIGVLLYGPFDRNPALAQFRGTTLYVENANGRILEELEVGRKLVRKLENGEVKDPVAFADAVGDETRELFWGASPGEDARLDVLRAKAVGADTLLWERPLRFDVDFPNKPEVSSPTFGIANLTAEDLNRDGSPELYAVVNHRPYFPSLVLRLRPTDGTVQQRYVHPGHLRSGIETADLVGGPTPELLIGGHSNALEDPVLTILRPSDMAGHAPTRGAYGVEGMEPAPHVAYLRFPSTPLQKQWPTTYPMVWQIRPAPATRTLEVVTQDGRSPGKNAWRPKVISTLSYDLRPQSVGTDGGYDRLAESLARRGVLEAVPGPEDLRRYGEEIWYWTGSGWSQEPSFVIGSPN